MSCMWQKKLDEEGKIMKEYIEREAVIEKCNKLLNNADSCPEQHILDGVKLVRDLILIDEETRVPAADVEPVRHGRWLDTDTFDFHCVHIYQCSNCLKEVADDYIDNHKFCLHCGTKMDGGNSNGTV